MGRAQKPRVGRLVQAARDYQRNLLNRNVLLVGVNASGSVAYLQLRFLARHFMHLTGARTTTGIRSTDFLRRCASGRIAERELAVDARGFAALKLEAARAMFQPDLSATTFGSAGGARLYVTAERYAGNGWACLGFVKHDGWNDPVTLLRSPVDDEVADSGKYRVVAVFSKRIDEPMYERCVEVALREGDDWQAIVGALPEEFAYLDVGE